MIHADDLARVGDSQRWKRCCGLGKALVPNLSCGMPALPAWLPPPLVLLSFFWLHPTARVPLRSVSVALLCLQGLKNQHACKLQGGRQPERLSQDSASTKEQQQQGRRRACTHGIEKGRRALEKAAHVCHYEVTADLTAQGSAPPNMISSIS